MPNPTATLNPTGADCMGTMITVLPFQGTIKYVYVAFGVLSIPYYDAVVGILWRFIVIYDVVVLFLRKAEIIKKYDVF